MKGLFVSGVLTSELIACGMVHIDLLAQYVFVSIMRANRLNYYCEGIQLKLLLL